MVDFGSNLKELRLKYKMTQKELADKIGVTKSVAREYASRNIRCNAVAPGFITTDMTDSMTQQAKDAVVAQIPSGKLGTSQDVAKVVAFLLSDDAGYITGEVIKVAGGMGM